MNHRKLIFIALLSVSVTACSSSLSISEADSNSSVPSPTSKKEVEEKDQPSFEGHEGQKAKTVEKPVRGDDGLIIVDEPKSITVVVNKNRKLPDGYTPPDLAVPEVPFYFDEFLPKKQMRAEAAQALEKLFEGAEQDGVDLVAASGFRSYERQKNLFKRYVKQYGEEEAKTFSAKPGTSEHQTGLAMDVTSAQMSFKLNESFGQQEGGKWLADHAYEYGFIIRYPKGKENITGYTYEPWHLRYVGKEISTKVHQQEATLEEFFGFQPAKQ